MQSFKSSVSLLCATLLTLLFLTSCNAQTTVTTTAPTETDALAASENTGTPAFDWSSVGDIAAVTAGRGYSFLLSDDGKLYSWGDNDAYTLGIYEWSVLFPTVVLDDVIGMSAGTHHAGAITSDGKLWLWGDNVYHQVRVSEDEYLPEPVQVKDGVKNVVCADGFTVVLDTSGTVWTFGSNETGQLGIGTTESTDETADVLHDVFKIAAGKSFTLALKSDGSLWGWGLNNYGQLLGYSNDTIKEAGQEKAIQSEPVKLMDGIVDIACGASHTMVLDSAGNVYTWGLNSSGQLGNMGAGTWLDVNFGGSELVSAEPSLVMADVRTIAAGASNSAAIKRDDTLWMWGSNSRYQLGDGTSASSTVPVQVMGNVRSVSVSATHVMALTTANTYYAWGSNTYNTLGDGKPTLIYEPVAIMDNVRSASLSNGHALVVTENNELYAFGSNSLGQLGTGNFLTTSQPTFIMSDVTKAAAGIQHSVCLKTDGSVWTWGSNAFGQLGNGNEDDVYAIFDVWRDGHPVWSNVDGEEVRTTGPVAYHPTQVLTNALDIFAKHHTSYAITNKHVLYGWGWNELYQLGNDSRTSTATPQVIMENVQTLIPSYALVRNNNVLWTWGSNMKDPYNILPIESLADVQSAAVLDRQFLAVKDDNTLWVWGAAISGALLGVDDYFNTVLDPVQIGTGIKRVYADNRNIYVIDTNDALWSLDTNTITVKAADKMPSDVFTYADEYKIMDNVSDICVSSDSVLILKKDGTLWGFGSNEHGQLGGGQRFFTPQEIS